MTSPLICVTVTAATTVELRARRDAVTDADLIELRLDTVADPSAAGALAGRRTPVIVTCRPTWEGGHFRGTEQERRAILSEALALGAEYVDVEWGAGLEDLIGRTGGRRIVISSHDFNGVPADLASRLQAMRATGAEVVKVAAQTHSLCDCLPLLEAGAAWKQRPGLVLIGMGEHGVATRVLAQRFGSMWSYAGAERAIGQVSVEALVNQYRFRSISERTEVYGLVGSPIGHSASPAMHNAALAAARIDAVYLPLPAVDADDFVRFGRAIGIKGASVTIPFKIALMDRLDESYAVARRIGAINTMAAIDRRWIGGNTDAAGFLEPLRDRLGPAGARASILGAGGAARAVAVALASASVGVTVHARDGRRAREIAMLVGGGVGPWPPPRGSWDLLVNCTPVGMHPHEGDTPIPAQELTGRLVYDLAYNPPVTRLMRDALRAGCDVIGGLDMLVAQAREQFHWWFGTRPAAGVMRQAAEAHLAQFTADAERQRPAQIRSDPLR